MAGIPVPGGSFFSSAPQTSTGLTEPMCRYHIFRHRQMRDPKALDAIVLGLSGEIEAMAKNAAIKVRGFPLGRDEDDAVAGLMLVLVEKVVPGYDPWRGPFLNYARAYLQREAMKAVAKLSAEKGRRDEIERRLAMASSDGNGRTVIKKDALGGFREKTVPGGIRGRREPWRRAEERRDIASLLREIKKREPAAYTLVRSRVVAGGMTDRALGRRHGISHPAVAKRMAKAERVAREAMGLE